MVICTVQENMGMYAHIAIQIWKSTNMVNNRRLMVDDPDKTMSINGTTESVDPVTLDGLSASKDINTVRIIRYMQVRTSLDEQTTCIFRYLGTIPYPVSITQPLFMTVRTDPPICFPAIPPDWLTSMEKQYILLWH